MGIYISGVKGLPEQVQENKNKIKEVEEQIEGIDFDAIRQLETKVGENTQDINNLEAAIGVQNQAINGLKDDVDALESKTQKITYDEQSVELTIDANVNVKRINITAAQTPLRADSMVSQDDKNAISLTGANDEISLIVGRTGTQHVLNFNADGTLDIDGNPVGASDMYVHRIPITLNTMGTFCLEVKSTRNTAYDYNTLQAWIQNKQFGSTNSLRINEIISLAGTTFYRVDGIYNSGSNIMLRYENLTSGTSSTTSNLSIGTDSFYKID